MTALYLIHLGLNRPPFSKEVEPEELWIPPSKQDLVEQVVEAHIENERRILSALPTAALANLDAALSTLLQALEGSPGDRRS